MKIGIKRKRSRQIIIIYFDTSFWSVQVSVYVLLIKIELATRSVDNLNCFTETLLVAKKKPGGPLLEMAHF